MLRVSMAGLRAFERVVATGSQREAGIHLGVTQTAISHAIKSLEAQLGTKLFQRDGASSSLTRTGKELAQELEPAFGKIDRAVERLVDNRDLVTISTTPAFAACWLAPELAQHAISGKTLPLRIHAANDVMMLSSNSVGLAVRYAREAEGEHLVKETFHAVTSSSLESYDHLPDNLPLLETAWVHGRQYAPTWCSWFDLSGKKLQNNQKPVQFSDEHQTLQAALAGTGVALVSCVLSAPLIKQGFLKVIRPDIGVEGLSYWLMTAPDITFEKNVTLISNWIKSRMSEMVLENSDKTPK